MDYVTLLLTLFAVDMLAVISPGPNFVVTMETAVRHRTRAAIAVVLGIAMGDLLWSLAALLGLSAVFKLWPWLYTAVKIAGGGYLIYLGVMAWRSKEDHAFGNMASGATTRSTWSAYLRGIVTSLTNPKSMAYYGSIFALFLRPHMPIWVQTGLVSIGVFDALLWYSIVAFLFSSEMVQRFYVRIERWTRRITGAVMMGFGAKLLLEKD